MLHCRGVARSALPGRGRAQRGHRSDRSPVVIVSVAGALREFTFVIPGLLWPAESIAELTAGLALPALAELLAGEAVTRHAAQSLEHLLATTWGVDPAAAPYAALRLAGAGIDPGDAIWMGADPAHLRFVGESLVLADPREIEIAGDEAARLVAALNESFADLGEFSATTAGEWHLRLPDPPQIATHPMSQALGRNIEAWLPDGQQRSAWRRTMNEIQMLLHGHPVNAAREAAGKPPINTVWLWGAGRLDAPPPRRFDLVYANRALARGFAATAGAQAAPLPARLPRTHDERVFALIDALDYPALSRDATAWRAAIMELEAAWLAPALAALEAGEIGALRLLLPADAACLELACAKRSWWKSPWRFGRRDLALAAFVERHALP